MNYLISLSSVPLSSLDFKVMRASSNIIISFPDQVVAFLSAMEIMAEQFPGAFSGYHLEVQFYPEYPF
jgi:hypothetical protein